MNNSIKISFSNTFIIFIIFLISCKFDKKPDEKSLREEVQSVSVPEFNADSAYIFVKKQVEFGPRVPNSPEHKACREYLVEKFKSYGAVVVQQDFTELSFDEQTLNLTNIIVSFNPNRSKRILLAAHWDTRPFADKDVKDLYKPIDGANDGGSGVGVLIEIARQISLNSPPNAGIDIILFDGEDYGEPENYEEKVYSGKINWCLGSQYWSKNKHARNYMAYYGILLDMVGAANATFYKEGGSMQFAKKIVNKVWNAGSSIGYSNYFIAQNAPGITDDHIFVNRDAKIPMINIVEYKPDNSGSYFAEYHHTHNDNMDIIDPVTLKAVGQTLLQVLYTE